MKKVFSEPVRIEWVSSKKIQLLSKSLIFESLSNRRTFHPLETNKSAEILLQFFYLPTCKDAHKSLIYLAISTVYCRWILTHGVF